MQCHNETNKNDRYLEEGLIIFDPLIFAYLSGFKAGFII